MQISLEEYDLVTKSKRTDKSCVVQVNITQPRVEQVQYNFRYITLFFYFARPILESGIRVRILLNSPAKQAWSLHHLQKKKSTNAHVLRQSYKTNFNETKRYSDANSPSLSECRPTMTDIVKLTIRGKKKIYNSFDKSCSCSGNKCARKCSHLVYFACKIQFVVFPICLLHIIKKHRHITFRCLKPICTYTSNFG